MERSWNKSSFIIRPKRRLAFLTCAWTKIVMRVRPSVLFFDVLNYLISGVPTEAKVKRNLKRFLKEIYQM